MSHIIVYQKKKMSHRILHGQIIVGTKEFMSGILGKERKSECNLLSPKNTLASTKEWDFK